MFKECSFPLKYEKGPSPHEQANFSKYFKNLKSIVPAGQNYSKFFNYSKLTVPVGQVKKQSQKYKHSHTNTKNIHKPSYNLPKE